jgi:hypothetical protein
MSLIPSLGMLKASDINSAIVMFITTFGAWLLVWSIFYSLVRNYTKPDLEPEEKVIKTEWGSCFSADGIIGGMLYLTTNKMVFRSHFCQKNMPLGQGRYLTLKEI